MRDGVKRTIKTSQDKKDIKKQLKMKIKPEKRKVPENLNFSQKQLPSAWNESDWLTNCRPIHIVKLRENRKRFS